MGHTYSILNISLSYVPQLKLTMSKKNALQEAQKVLDYYSGILTDSLEKIQSSKYLTDEIQIEIEFYNDNYLQVIFLEKLLYN